MTSLNDEQDQVVLEIKNLFLGFEEVEIRWVRWSANNVAHILSRKGCMNKLCKSRLKVPLESVILVVASEFAAI